MMRAGALLLWLLCFSCVVLAQEPVTPEKPAQKPEKEDRSSTIRVDTDLVVFDVKVVNRASGLTATIDHFASDPQFTPPIIYSRDERSRLVFLTEAVMVQQRGVLPGQPVSIGRIE